MRRLSDDKRCHFVVTVLWSSTRHILPCSHILSKDYHFRCSAFELNFRILKTHSTERWSRAKWNYASFSEGKRTFDEGKAAKSAGLCLVSQLASSNRGTHRAATKPFASRCQLMGRRIDDSQCVDTAYRIDVIHSVQPNIT